MSNIVGIDLGTTYSVIAKLNDTGKPEIIENAEGKNVTPSVVEFTSETGVVVGESAKAQLAFAPENIAHEVKRSMGSSSETYEFFGKTHNPTSISALILTKLKNDFEKSYGPIDSAVVTVPANFANEAREATQKAATDAGLNVEFVINEPTAAALNYAFQTQTELSGTFVIYDFGGGTFDCSVARITGQEVDLLTSEGVAKLGGKDFDLEITKLVSSKYQDQAGKQLDPMEFTSNDAEDLKRRLTTREKADARVGGEVISITREEFSSAISNLILQAELAVETALTRVGVSVSDVSEVILVGGSTRVPAVQESIKKIFNKEPKLYGNPDESVALGAAIYAAYKTDTQLNPLQRQAISKLSLSEAAPFYFGILVNTEVASGERESQNSIIIKKDENIPCEITETYYTSVDGQESVRCSVTQSPTAETDPNFVSIIWEGDLKVMGGRPAGQEVNVTYGYSEDGKMKCSFFDPASKNLEEIELTITSSNASNVNQSDVSGFEVE